MKRSKACVHCDKWHPALDEECWSLDKNKNKRPKGPPTERMFTALQMEQIAKALSAKAAKTKTKKRKVSYMSKPDDSDNNSTSSESESYMYMSFCNEYKNINLPIQTPSLNTSNAGIERSFAIRNTLSSNQPNPKSGNRPTTEMVVELISPKGTTKPIRCLIDTGTTRSLVLKDMVMLSQVTERKPTTWQTMSGSLVTNKIAQVVFKLPELSASKQITWTCHVDETSKREKVPYDIILGLDFLSELKFVLNFESRTIQWEDHEVEMRPKGIVTDQQALDLIYQITQEPSVLKQAEERQARILDADYSKVEMTEFVESP